MAVFPLPHPPLMDFLPTERGGHRLWYGAPRPDWNGKRKHAGVDIVTTPGTEVFAMTDGEVRRIAGFTDKPKTYAIEMIHRGELPGFESREFIVRYCELYWPNLAVGDTVSEGQQIAKVKKMKRDCMLHLELYRTASPDGLTDRSNKPWERRADHADPTQILYTLINNNNFVG